MKNDARHSTQTGNTLPSSIPSRVSRIIQQFAQESKSLLRSNIYAEYLFGSYATNTHTTLSDIDILILIDAFTPEIRQKMSGLASDYSLEYGVYISPIIKDQDVWEKNKQHHTLFYQDVVRNGILL